METDGENLKAGNFAQPAYGTSESLACGNSELDTRGICQNFDILISDEDNLASEFQPSPSRFIIAFLIVLSNALNCFLQYTFVSIW